MKSIPKFKITIDDEYSEGEDLGISQIAFTSKPAIITKGFAFSSDEPLKKFFSDDLKYRICAPAMIPMEIYRFSDEDGEYMVEFTVEEIDKIHQKFMSEIKTKDVFNLEHDSEHSIPAFVLEAWTVSEPSTDKAFTKFGIEVPAGTLMLTTQLTDKEVYSELVNSGRVGYSIEGFLGLKLSEIKQKLASEPPFHEDCKCFLVGDNVVSQEGVCDYCLEQTEKLENKQKLNTMENKLDLPAGEYPVGENKILVVAEDGTFEIKVKEEAPIEEAMSIDVEEEIDAELAVDPNAPVEAPVEEPVEAPVEVAPTYTKEEVDAKFEEIYKIIGEMKAEDDSEEEIEIPAATQLSVHDRFAEFVRFSRGV